VEVGDGGTDLHAEDELRPGVPIFVMDVGEDRLFGGDGLFGGVGAMDLHVHLLSQLTSRTVHKGLVRVDKATSPRELVTTRSVLAHDQHKPVDTVAVSDDHNVVASLAGLSVLLAAPVVGALRDVVLVGRLVKVQQVLKPNLFSLGDVKLTVLLELYHGRRELEEDQALVGEDGVDLAHQTEVAEAREHKGKLKQLRQLGVLDVVAVVVKCEPHMQKGHCLLAGGNVHHPHRVNSSSVIFRHELEGHPVEVGRSVGQGKLGASHRKNRSTLFVYTFNFEFYNNQFL
jgi:hypothetical protein